MQPSNLSSRVYEQAVKDLNLHGIEEQLSEYNHSEDVKSQEKKQAKLPGTVTCHQSGDSGLLVPCLRVSKP